VSTSEKSKSLTDLAIRTSVDPAFAGLRETGAALVLGEGPFDARIAVVGEAPGYYENLQGRPFVGDAGILLGKLLEYGGIERGQCWVTNLVKYQPPGNRNPRYGETLSGRIYLRHELAIIGPELVVLCGKYAFQSVFPGLSISKFHGTPLRTEARRYLPVFHPAACLRDSTRLHETYEDFAKIKELLRRDEPNSGLST